MSIDKTIQILGNNLKALRKSELTPEESRGINRFAKWVGVPNGTVDRIEKGTTDPQISHVLKVAAKYRGHGIRPWHLFVEDLNPLDPPDIISRAEQEAYDAIGEAMGKLNLPAPGASIDRAPQAVAHRSVKKRTKSA